MSESHASDILPPVSGKTGWPWTMDPVTQESIRRAQAQFNSWPKITIVTPSFSQGQYIEETIRSVLMQGYPNLEYFVMDGGSTDATVEILKKYEPWLTGWVSEKDKGQTHAINKGLQQSKGELIAYINSDDWYQPGAFFSIASRFLSRPSERWWVGVVDYRSEDYKRADPKKSCMGDLARFLGRAENLHQPGVFWHREAMDRAGLFDLELHYGFDIEYWARLWCAGYRPVNLDSPMANFRQHALTKTSTRLYLFMAELWELIRRYRDRMSPAEQKTACELLAQYEADYLTDSVYGLLVRKQRWVALKYLLKRISLLPKLSPRRLYLGALWNILITGRAPSWFDRSS